MCACVSLCVSDSSLALQGKKQGKALEYWTPTPPHTHSLFPPCSEICLCPSLSRNIFMLIANGPSCRASNVPWGQGKSWWFGQQASKLCTPALILRSVSAKHRAKFPFYLTFAWQYYSKMGYLNTSFSYS